MKRVLTAAAAAAVAAAGAVPAMAGGLAPVATEPAPVVAPAPAMTPDGDWTGFSAGLSLGYGDATTSDNDFNGGIYGIRGAYDYDFGKWVLGGVASYDWSNFEKGGDKLKGIGRVGLRGGVDLGNTYLYATGGAAWADANVRGNSGTDSGWFAGIGGEYQLQGNWVVGGEVLTNQFKDFKNSGTDLKATTVALNVGLRF